MCSFDVSKEWIILAPFEAVRAAKGAADLAGYIDLLRRQCGIPLPPPIILDAAGPAPAASAPVIVLNSGGERDEYTGFSWRAGPEQVEIYGESDRGLCNGIYDFLRKTGVFWPAPGKERLPPPALPPGSLGDYALKEKSVWKPSGDDKSGGGRKERVRCRRRLVFGPGDSFKKPEALIAWAARNGVDALVLPFRGAPGAGFSQSERSRKALVRAAWAYGLIIEEGGWGLSRLLPRRLFLFHRDMFRMEGGKRRKQHHFCPTNPDTVKVIQREASALFKDAKDGSVFHLWPDQGAQEAWCSCPTCRAFSPKEQNRIAVNAAADTLYRINPRAFLSFYEPASDDEAGGISIRPNMYPLERLPGEKGAEERGLFTPAVF